MGESKFKNAMDVLKNFFKRMTSFRSQNLLGAGDKEIRIETLGKIDKELQKLTEKLEKSQEKLIKYKQTENDDKLKKEMKKYNEIAKKINELEKKKQEIQEQMKKEELKEKLQASAERMKEYRKNGDFDLEAAESANYNKIVNELNELENKPKQVNQPNNENARKEQLQKELQASAERMKEYRKNGDFDLEAAERANYSKIVNELNELENKHKQAKQPSNENTKKEQLQKELQASSERMREYRKNGDFDLEAAEHANYNKIVNELDKLENKPKQVNQSKQTNQPSNENARKEQLQKELQASAERMRAYRENGNFDLEAAEHANYNKIVNELNEIENKSRQSEKTSINNEKNNSLKWHPKLTKEQIEELLAEGIEPGDNEYRLALYNYGINPNEQVKIAEKEIEKSNSLKWNPKLTEEQIDYAISKGIYEPVGNEYRQFLIELGINPTFKENMTVSKKEMLKTNKTSKTNKTRDIDDLESNR